MTKNEIYFICKYNEKNGKYCGSKDYFLSVPLQRQTFNSKY